MNPKMKNIAIVSVFVFSQIIGHNAFGFSGGISGYSGNPATNAGNSCSSCHSGGTAPTVTISGPSAVQPGTISRFTFIISGGQQHSGGLDISADGGTLISTQASTRLLATEITHKQRATAITDGTVSWRFDWQAPTTPGPYTLYAAGLSTNGDGNTLLDAVANYSHVVMVSSGAPQSPTAIIMAPVSAQLNTSVSFDASASSDPDGTINQYEWNFADGSTASGAQATHIFDKAGNYTVTLIVTDSHNLTHSTFWDISVGGIMVPVADLGGSYTGTEAQAISFDASLSSHVEPITHYIWDFGDGSAVVQGVIATTTHAYNQPGAYTLTLAVQDANIITGVASTSVLINATPPAPPATDGSTLYANNCASCHGVLASSNKINKTANQIQAAIDANTGGMAGLSSLTPTELQAIADALVSVDTPPTPSTGQQLYDSYCLVCHGAGGNGGLYKAVTGENASNIGSAINSEPLMNSIILDAGQIQSIADYLSSTTPAPPLTGEALYATYCLACHGASGKGGLYEDITGKDADKISNAIAGEPLMNSISLSTEQIQNIADYLSNSGGGGSPPPPAPTDGVTLYTNNCSGCHGALPSSSKLDRSASQIQAAIDANTGGMAGLSSLTPTNIQAIADALISTGGTPPPVPPPVPADGITLYTSNCSGCHNPLASSSKLKRSASQIQAAIDANTGGMGGLSNLNSAEILAIADALAGGGNTPTPTTGEQRYIALCQNCHGFNGTGGSAKAIVGVNSNQITTALSNIAAMQNILLTATDAQDIASFLASGGGAQPPPTTGADIYAIKCGACHGPAGNGGDEKAIIGVSAMRILKAIQNVNEMQAIPLSNGEAQALATYLSGEDHKDGGHNGMGHGDGHN